MLTIETSLHNEIELAKELSRQLNWAVYGLEITEYPTKYDIQWKSENGTIWALELDRVAQRNYGVGKTYMDYYKLSCGKAVWYLRRDEITDIDTFVFNIKGVVDEWIKLK